MRAMISKAELQFDFKFKKKKKASCYDLRGGVGELGLSR